MDLDTTVRPAPKNRTRPAFDRGDFTAGPSRRLQAGVKALNRDEVMVCHVDWKGSQHKPGSTAELARQKCRCSLFAGIDSGGAIWKLASASHMQVPGETRPTSPTISSRRMQLQVASTSASR